MVDKQSASDYEVTYVELNIIDFIQRIYIAPPWSYWNSPIEGARKALYLNGGWKTVYGPIP